MDNIDLVKIIKERKEKFDEHTCYMSQLKIQKHNDCEKCLLQKECFECLNKQKIIKSLEKELLLDFLKRG